MLLHLSTWQEVETYLQRSPSVIIPIGSTEQHEPTGLIGTDFNDELPDLRCRLGNKLTILAQD